MDMKVSKINPEMEFFNARIDAIPMSDVEKLRAKAQLARAELVAEMVAEVIEKARHGLHSLVDHGHGATPSHG